MTDLPRRGKYTCPLLVGEALSGGALVEGKLAAATIKLAHLHFSVSTQLAKGHSDQRRLEQIKHTGNPSLGSQCDASCNYRCGSG